MAVQTHSPLLLHHSRGTAVCPCMRRYAVLWRAVLWCDVLCFWLDGCFTAGLLEPLAVSHDASGACQVLCVCVCVLNLGRCVCVVSCSAESTHIVCCLCFVFTVTPHASDELAVLLLPLPGALFCEDRPAVCSSSTGARALQALPPSDSQAPRHTCVPNTNNNTF
jgi:hypothetical protein